MMFHRALPDENGFGVKTFTPGLIRSGQSLMPFGLPLRTTSETTESVTKPCSGFESQSAATRFFLTSFVMSVNSENSTTSAAWPARTAAAWSPDAP